MIYEYKRKKKARKNKKYNNNNKTNIKIFYDVREQNLYRRGKDRGITLSIMQ